MGVYLIAEAGCSWRYGDELATARRSIQAAKACGADAWKSQWTSDPQAMAKRRGRDADYSRLAWPSAYHETLRDLCREAGLDYLCTAYLPRDVDTVARYVNRFKVSAFEAMDRELIEACQNYRKPIILSLNPGEERFERPDGCAVLHCISEYPTKLERLGMKVISRPVVMKLKDTFTYSTFYQGLSDHSTSVLTGAVAVGASAQILEKHVRLWDTPKEDADYGHSLPCDQEYRDDWAVPHFAQYVRNVREAEKML